jgi:DNA-binding transcriptional ArsR family regulator
MDVFTALVDPNRRTILEMLALSGQLSATEISNQFRVSPPAISQHLKVLREARLVNVEKRAQNRMYSLNPTTVHEFAAWLERLTANVEERFQALDRVLEHEKKKLAAK